MPKDLSGVVPIGPFSIKVKISGGVIVVMNTVQVTFKGVDFLLYSLSKAAVPPLTRGSPHCRNEGTITNLIFHN